MAKKAIPKIWPEVFKDAPALLDKEIHTKPVTFQEDAGYQNCANNPGDTYLYNRTPDAPPNLGLPYPEPGETSICDVEISKTRWMYVTTIIITLSVTGIFLYAIHAAYLIKLASR